MRRRGTRFLSQQNHTTQPRIPVTKHQVTEFMQHLVPAHITRPNYVQQGHAHRGLGCIISSPREQQLMRHVCSLAAEMRELAGSLIKPGVTTDEIDKAVFNAIIKAGAYPSALGYMGFPKSLCSSINEVACHGIPDLRPLREGDIVKIDVVVFKDGFHGDCCGTFVAGKPLSEEDRVFAESAKICTHRALAECGPQVPLNRVGASVEAFCEENGYGVIEDFCGHGVGKEIHCEPYVFHHYNEESFCLAKDMFLTVEPILSQSGARGHTTWDDGWTIVVEDACNTVQHEETIMVTDNGPEILTRC